LLRTVGLIVLVAMVFGALVPTASLTIAAGARGDSPSPWTEMCSSAGSRTASSAALDGRANAPTEPTPDDSGAACPLCLLGACHPALAAQPPDHSDRIQSGPALAGIAVAQAAPIGPVWPDALARAPPPSS